MKYTESHEWIVAEKELGTVGITHVAQEELGEVVYVELPEVGARVKAGQEIAVLESTKAATDIYAPVSGEIAEVNLKLKEDPGLVNRGPEGEGWLFKLKLEDPAELEALMTKENYLLQL